MKHLFYIPRPDNLRDICLDNFLLKLPTYKVKYGISDADILKLTKGKAIFSYCLSVLNSIRTFNTTVTSFKNTVIKATPGTGLPTAFPSQPVLAAPPADLIFDVFTFAAYIGNRIKTHLDFNTTDGNDLRLIGIEQGSPDDPATWKPHLVAQRLGDFYNILWGWEGHPAEGMELQIDRGSGTFATVVVDPDPDYLDNVNVNTVPIPTNWRIRGIYRKNGVQVGQWSDIITVPVP
ncbi:MAG: hypothetical protein NTX03_12005 [Bacteroidetes bacterium]|nr:hypothetical protein [Bacteroidota bacterium]